MDITFFMVYFLDFSIISHTPKNKKPQKVLKLNMKDRTLKLKTHFLDPNPISIWGESGVKTDQNVDLASFWPFMPKLWPPSSSI